MIDVEIEKDAAPQGIVCPLVSNESAGVEWKWADLQQQWHIESRKKKKKTCYISRIVVSDAESELELEKDVLKK